MSLISEVVVVDCVSSKITTTVIEKPVAKNAFFLFVI